MMFCATCRVFSLEQVCWCCGEAYGLKTGPEWAAPHVYTAGREWYNVAGRSMKIDASVESLI